MEEALTENQTQPHTLVRRNDPTTSRSAAYAVAVTSMELKVLSVIKSFNCGCISDEVRGEFPSDRSYSSVTARYKALMEKGLIVDTGVKRPGKSGRLQRVMKAVQH